MQIKNDLQEVTINEWIWIIFVILNLSNIYGDELEKQSLKERKCHNNKAKKIFLTTASVALIIYIYFVINSHKKFKNLKQTGKNTKLQEINLLGNTLIFLGACALIYFNINNKQEITTELP